MYKKHTVYEGFSGLHFLKGVLKEVLAPGQYLFIGFGHECLNIDTRPVSELVGGQEVSTSDGAVFRITIIAQFRISDSANYYRSFTSNNPKINSRKPALPISPQGRLHQIIQTELRTWVMSRTFKEAIESQKDLTAAILPLVIVESKKFGAEIDSLNLLDFTITGGLKGALSDLLKVHLEGEVAFFRARNEAATMRSLINTSKLTREHPGLLELRMLSSGQRPRISFIVNREPGILKPDDVEEV